MVLDGGKHKSLVTIIFVISVVFVCIILLNILIAILSDSYERCQDRADIEFQFSRAKFILEMEHKYLSILQTVGYLSAAQAYPEWLHVLVPQGKATGFTSGENQWQGMLNDIKVAMDKKVGQMEGEITVVDRLDNQDQQIANLSYKMDQIISLLNANQK